MPARPRWWSIAVVIALALASDAGAAVQAPDDGQAAETAKDPAIRWRAGQDALRAQPREKVRARAIGESMIRDFPGTTHAVAGLRLIFRATDIQEDEASLAEVAALTNRLETIVAAAPSPSPELQQAAFELRRELDWTRGLLFVARGRAGEQEAFTTCAQIFEELAQRLGAAHERTAVALFNAGQCLMMVHELERARAMFQEVVDRHPHAEVAERADEELVDIARALARFEEAATLMERHAARYPKSRKASELLREAATIRAALGQVALLRADVALFERTWGRSAPEAAAGLRWLLVGLATTDAERRELADAYLLRHAKDGGRDRHIVAEATIGAIDWLASCPSGHADGLCVAPPPKPRRKVRRCAEPTTPEPRARSKRLAEAVLARLEVVVRLARTRAIWIPEADHRRRAEFLDAVGMSRIAVLDRELEALMAIELPTGLRLVVDKAATGEARRRQIAASEDSRRRLMTHLAATQKRAAELIKSYNELATEKRSVRATLAANYRVALLAEHVADQLLSAEIPRELAAEPARAAYCREMRSQAEPILEHARQAYLYCAVRALEYQSPTEASRACDAALARLTPREWPPLHEFVGEPAPWGELPLRSAGLQIEGEDEKKREEVEDDG